MRQKNPSTLSCRQSDGDNPSAEIPSFQMMLACVKLTEAIQYNPPATWQPLPIKTTLAMTFIQAVLPMNPYFLLFSEMAKVPCSEDVHAYVLLTIYIVFFLFCPNCT